MDGPLTARGIGKAFGTNVALAGVDAEFSPGEVHAVLGENGAGKSTLMNVLAGFVRPDAGEVSWGGRALPLGRPAAVRAMGVGMVHQHFALVPAMTVEENLALAAVRGPFDLRSRREQAAPALAAAERLGWRLDPAARVAELAVGDRQRIEIVKALGAGAGALILDEPTAVLTPDEVSGLFDAVRNLAAGGRIVVLIAHKLAEVFAVADRLTVLRRGVRVGEAAVGDTCPEEVARWMIGEDPTPAVRVRREPGEAVVRAEEVRVLGDQGEEAVRGATFEVRAGEVVGFGGVDGNGQTELAEALVGVRPPLGGLTTPPETAYVPQDRQRDGLALNLDLTDNVSVVAHRNPGYSRGGWIRTKGVRDLTEEIVRRFDVRGGGARTPAGALSGGNQQKVVLGRALAESPRLLVAVNPTRGLDLKATAFVHASLRDAASRGVAVALFSTDRDELAAVADRTLYLDRGRVRSDARAAVAGEGA